MMNDICIKEAEEQCKEILEEYAERFKADKVFISNIGHMSRKSGLIELPQIFEI